MREAIEAIKGLTSGRTDVEGVEVDVAQCDNAKNILENWLELKLLNLVDVNEHMMCLNAALKLAKPFAGRFKVYPQSSEEASKRFGQWSVDFVYIDAGHEYEDVKSDIKHWFPKIKGGGLLGGHDYVNDTVPGVKKAVDEWVAENNMVLNTKGLDWWVII